MQRRETIESYMTKNAKLIWAETPTNPMMNVVDIEAISKISKKHKVLLAVDNTFATAYLERPLDFGADIVMHSATKYLGGHSDVISGSIVVNDDKLAEQLYFIQNASGGIAGPMDSFIKTLHLRMQRHSENGRAMAEYLKNHPKVENGYWLGPKDHPNHYIAKKQIKDFGGMVSFTTKGNSYKEAIKFVESIKVFTLAESLGGIESIAGHPASITHASIPRERKNKCFRFFNTTECGY
jgi:cystathionine beta-lyase/cystathionine gamma-synthase